MTQEIMDPELFADFIIEAKEHLETIEPNLLELEKNPDNLGLLNEIFRPMHSLKGASGFLGLNRINHLAHRSENILDELRKGNMAVTSDIMDVILESTDALRSMIDSLETDNTEGDIETEDIVNRIDAIMAGDSVPEPAEPSTPERADEPEALDGAMEDPEKKEESSPPALEAPPIDDSDLPLTRTEPLLGEPYKLSVIGEGHLADFLEEAREIIEALNSNLVTLENDDDEDLVNDIFRYFHNLKGNSGVIGHKEINTLTHEAETLFNRVRKHELKVTRPLIDLMLASVDMLEVLLNQIDTKLMTAREMDISPLVSLLKKSGEGVSINVVEISGQSEETDSASKEPAVKSSEAQPQKTESSDSLPDPDDVSAFVQTSRQLMQNIKVCLEELAKAPDNKDLVANLARALQSLQNVCNYMSLTELKVYAERTAGLVDQARKSDLPFDALQDILEQECAILNDMLEKSIEAMISIPIDVESRKAPPAAPEEKKAASEAAPKAPAKEETKISEVPDPVKESASKAASAEEKKAVVPGDQGKAAPKPSVPAPTSKPAPASKPAAAPAKPQGAAPPTAAAGDKGKISSATIRVDHEKLDHLMNLIGELIINRGRFSMLTRSLEEGKQDVQDIAQQMGETTYSMARISNDLQDTIMKVRMVPVSTVFSRFPRLVRDLSKKSGKNINLITEGEDTELDKSLVEVIGDPLVHLIRNSVDHGLETEEERKALGKPEVGRVWLRAFHRGNSVAIEIEDDGKGIDANKMREVSVKKGLLSAEEAKNLDDRDAVELIFAPGFSSADKITDISGRGVGMDVVRTNIKNLKGTVSVSTEVGKGTKFTLALPLTLAIIDALMVVVDGQTYAIPLDSVLETTKLEMSLMTEVNKRKAITLRGEVLGIVEMREILEIPAVENVPDVVPVVILQDNMRPLGIIVDKLLERQEVVIKPLGPYLSEFDIQGISGATIMGDGSVVLILDPHEIYMMSTTGLKGGVS